MTRPSYQEAIDQLGLLDVLVDFDPVVIGTPPLGIATDKSDIDIACSANNLDTFATFAKKQFTHHQDFQLRDIDHLNEPACVATFKALDWEFELFCQTLKTSEQWGVRHFIVEQRLLNLCPQLAQGITKLKEDGIKTEPAFAQVLALDGDPYEAVLKLETYSDEDLQQLIAKR